MAKVTAKYQVTVPKSIANRYQIHPGDEIDRVEAGGVIRVIPRGRQPAPETREERLRLFDQATERHRTRNVRRRTAATTRSVGGHQIPGQSEALREAEEFLKQFKVLYPNEAMLRNAMRGCAAYQLNWFDAHL